MIHAGKGTPILFHEKTVVTHCYVCVIKVGPFERVRSLKNDPDLVCDGCTD